MIVTNNDGTLTKMPIDSMAHVTRNTQVHRTDYTSTSVKETRTREVSGSPMNR